MRRGEKAERIGVILDDLYPDPPIPLDHRDPYTLLVAVALSAQTTDKKVNQVTPALFDRAPTPAAMAALDPDEILGYIREVGLAPTKSKNLWTAANQIVDAGGEVIGDWAFLESLAGVGPQDGQRGDGPGLRGAGLSRRHPHPPAGDALGAVAGTNVDQTERDLKKAFPASTWNARHLQIIYFGREYCPALRHDLTACPICSFAASKAMIARSRRPLAKRAR